MLSKTFSKSLNSIQDDGHTAGTSFSKSRKSIIDDDDSEDAFLELQISSSSEVWPDVFFQTHRDSFDCTDDPVPKDVFERLNEQGMSTGEEQKTKESNINQEWLVSKIVCIRGEISALTKELRRLEKLYFLTKQSATSSPKMFLKLKTRRCPVRFNFKNAKSQRSSTTQSCEPASKSSVSVLFSDIVGFTTISSKLSAAKVSDLLRRLYARFDALATKHGVTNVDIMGDAYMAATNLHDDQHSDHAARLARFAIDAVRAAQDTPIDADSPDSPSVQIRVGVHCGPVSACVLGAHGGKLTLVGDTVNVASRMESCSIPGHVQCSEAAAALIARQAPDVELEPRAGGVHVKGKGQMRTYWVGSAVPGKTLAGRPLPRQSSAADATASLCRKSASAADRRSSLFGCALPWGVGGPAAPGPPVDALRRTDPGRSLGRAALRVPQTAQSK